MENGTSNYFNEPCTVQWYQNKKYHLYTEAKLLAYRHMPTCLREVVSLPWQRSRIRRGTGTNACVATVAKETLVKTEGRIALKIKMCHGKWKSGSRLGTMISVAWRGS